MKVLRVFLIMSLVMFQAYRVSAQVRVENLVCEYLTNPIGIDIASPRLSWKLVSEDYSVSQAAYEIKAALSVSELKSGKNLVWKSGKVESAQSVHVPYQGRPLASHQRVYWKVRVWDQNGRVSRWSNHAYWETGLLQAPDWKANWITMAEPKADSSLPSQYYRKEFSVAKSIKSARAYVSSLGLYQLHINGKKVGEHLFTPGFTSYKKRIQYQVYDVTTMLSDQNAIGAIVGDGWYRGYLGWKGGRSYYGDQLSLIAQLHIEYKDGTAQVINTDEDWKVSYGPILKSDIYNGEQYDARLEMPGWDQPGFDESSWKSAVKLDHSKEILVATNGLPVKAIEEIKPIEKIITPKGEVVFDLGQNIVGWARLKVSGKPGDQVTLKFAEVLDKEGNFFTKNLRAADATDIYTLKGGKEEVFEPHFTFHGFRYILVEGYPGTPALDDITGVVIHSDMAPTGNFSCSDSLINQLQSNIRWSQRDNFLDIPTDCPQRDERVGWTGDAQVFSMTATFNFGVAPFYTKWLKDLALDQQPDGEVPNVIPDMWDNHLGGTTAWGDAAVIVPWTIYQAYGDVGILEEQYASMKAWVDYMNNKSGDDFLWNQKRKHHWGDWLSFHSTNPGYSGAYTEKDLIATAYFNYSATILSKAAAVIGKKKDAEYYKQLADNVKKAFTKEYITPNGRMVSHTQTAYALGLSFDLIPDDLREESARYFAEDVESFKHLTTGFVGTPLLCKTLSDIDRDDLAFMLLNRKEYPGWLYPVTQGATTIWERWDAQRPDGTIIDGMNSFNHYAYGAIGEWLYSHVAGLQIDENAPGYKHILFGPHPGGGLTSAKVEFESIYGKIVSSWRIENGKINYEIVLPPNTSGSVDLPGVGTKQVLVKDRAGKVLNLNRYENLGSGKYVFSYDWD